MTTAQMVELCWQSVVSTDGRTVFYSLSPALFSCLLSGEVVIDLPKDDTHTIGWESMASLPIFHTLRRAEGSQHCLNKSEVSAERSPTRTPRPVPHFTLSRVDIGWQGTPPGA